MNISRTIPIFLISAILVFGTTISTGIPASFAQSYEDSYGKDNYDKKKTSNLNKQKVNCNNIIINGVNSAGQGAGGGDMINPMPNEGDNDGTGQWIENGDKKESNGIDNNILNFCKNKHNKIVVAAEEAGTGTLSITKTITCTPIQNTNVERDACRFMIDGGPQVAISPDEFTIDVKGNNPDPSSFPGSNTPEDVTIGAGGYLVSETADASVDEAIENIKDRSTRNIQINGPIVTFSEDCTQQESTGVGSIAEGDQQTCIIDNEFEVNEVVIPPS